MLMRGPFLGHSSAAQNREYKSLTVSFVYGAKCGSYGGYAANLIWESSRNISRTLIAQQRPKQPVKCVNLISLSNCMIKSDKVKPQSVFTNRTVR